MSWGGGFGEELGGMATSGFTETRFTAAQFK
jgi:hypothetical protein